MHLTVDKATPAIGPRSMATIMAPMMTAGLVRKPAVTGNRYRQNIHQDETYIQFRPFMDVLPDRILRPGLKSWIGHILYPWLFSVCKELKGLGGHKLVRDLAGENGIAAKESAPRERAFYLPRHPPG